MSQTIRTKKTDVEYSKINELIDDIQEKYKISKDVLLKYIDQARIDYQLADNETFNASGSYNYNFTVASNANAIITNMKAEDNISFESGTTEF